MSEFFLRIVNMSISASWLILAVLFLRFLIKRAPKWITVLLWGVVAVRLICPVSIESVMSLVPSAETINPEILSETPTPGDAEIPVTDSGVNPDAYEDYSQVRVESTEPDSAQILVTALAGAWICGIIMMTVYAAVSYYHLKSKIKTAVLLRDNVFQSENVVSPFVLGVIKPKIYLPWGIDERATVYVTAHEKAHIFRRDHIWKPIGFLILTFHWFNPLVWVGYILLCRDIELACDEKVIKNFNSEQKADYSQALLNCSVNRRVITACPLAFGEVNVKERVRTVLNYKKPAFWIIITAILVCAVVAICFLTDPQKTEKDEDPARTAETVAETSPNESGPVENGTDKDENSVPDTDTSIVPAESETFEETLPPEESATVDLSTTPEGSMIVDVDTPAEEITLPEESTTPAESTAPVVTQPVMTEWEAFLPYHDYNADTKHYQVSDSGEEVFDEDSSIKYLTATAEQNINGEFILNGENLNHLTWMMVGCDVDNGGMYIGVSMSMYHFTADGDFIDACNKAVTVSYDGSVVNDNTDFANKNFSISINGERVIVKSVVMSKGNGHQDYYFILDTDTARNEIYEIAFEWKAQ
ncbi:MAG: hypothetical protein IJO81_05905 [Clostridia bacterium]|nr:hypothetical protein [Clostridia bacterium]